MDKLQRKAAAPYRFRNQLRARLESICEMVEIGEIPDVVRDPKDNHVVAAATRSQSNYIVTGDEDLVVLSPYEGIEIVKPADFLKLVK